MVTKEELIAHAKECNGYIHPTVSSDWDKWLNKVNNELGGGCPCSYKRLKCPCPESVEELKSGDRCCCTVVVNKKYIDKYGSMFGGESVFLWKS